MDPSVNGQFGVSLSPSVTENKPRSLRGRAAELKPLSARFSYTRGAPYATIDKQLFLNSRTRTVYLDSSGRQLIIDGALKGSLEWILEDQGDAPGSSIPLWRDMLSWLLALDAAAVDERVVDRVIPL